MPHSLLKFKPGGAPSSYACRGNMCSKHEHALCECTLTGNQTKLMTSCGIAGGNKPAWGSSLEHLVLHELLNILVSGHNDLTNKAHN